MGWGEREDEEEKDGWAENRIAVRKAEKGEREGRMRWQAWEGEVQMSERRLTGRVVVVAWSWLCSNITFWVEGMGTKRAVDYWPKWINLTNNEGYLAPGDVRVPCSTGWWQ